MNGRVYAIEGGRLAIETELHGYTIVELSADADLQVGDQISWESELRTGAQMYRNDSTNRPIDVRVHAHLVSRSGVRQLLLP